MPHTPLASSSRSASTSPLLSDTSRSTSPPAGPLMTQWRARVQREEAVQLANLAARLPSVGEGATTRAEADRALGAQGEHLRCEALEVLQGLRRPLRPRFTSALATVQRALGEYEDICRPAGRPVIALGPRVVLTASGIAVLKGAFVGFDVGRDEILALHLGRLNAPAATFVAQTRKTLESAITDVVSRRMLAGHLNYQADVLPLARAPLSDGAIAGLMVLCGGVLGLGGYSMADDSTAAAVLGGYGVLMGTILLPVIIGLKQERFPFTGVSKDVRRNWQQRVESAADEESVTADSVDAESGPAQPALSLAVANVCPPRDVQAVQTALRKELARQYLDPPSAEAHAQSTQALKAAMAHAIEPVRERARHLLSLLRHPAHFANDATLQDLQAFLAALDASEAGGMHFVMFMRQFQVSARGMGWRAWDEPNARFRSDDGAAMPFAGLDVDDETFLADVRGRLSRVAEALAAPEESATPSPLFTSAFMGREIPGAARGMPHWLDMTLGLGMITLVGGAVGAVGGLAFGAATQSSLPEATAVGALSLGASLGLFAGAGFLFGENTVHDAHDITLNWYAHYRQQYVTEQLGVHAEAAAATPL